MFKKIFGNSLRITKATQLGKRELAIDLNPSRRLGTFTKQASYFKAAIDAFIESFDPNDKELAIYLLAPAIRSAGGGNDEQRAQIRAVIDRWLEEGQVRGEIAEMVLKELG